MASIILTHGDTDGICAAAIAHAAYPDAEIIFTTPTGLIDELEYAKSFSNIIICDIAFDQTHWRAIQQQLNIFNQTRNITYIDHHPLPEEIRASWLHHSLHASASELTYNIFKKMARVALYGAIGDFQDTTPFIQRLFNQWDKRSLYFYSGALTQAIIEIGRDYDAKREIVKALSKDIIPPQIKGVLSKALKASIKEEELRLRVADRVKKLSNTSYIIDANGYMSKAAIYAASYGNTPVGIAIERHRHKKVYDLSLRSQNQQIDLNKTLRTLTPAYDGTGGGHATAAGARIPIHNLQAFLKEFDRCITQQLTKQQHPRFY
jgi:RecJ-like exonuclease